MFCVYLTIYKGNKLPPFYIGYSSIKKIEEGYHGTVKSKIYREVWKKELKESNLFETKIISFCKTKEEAKTRETFFQRFFNVHTNPMYINRSIQGESFYRKKGEYNHSQETKDKIGKSNSLIMKGKAPPNKGMPMKNDQKIKLSEANRGKILSEEHKFKISNSLKGIRKTKEHIENSAKARRGVKYKEGRISHWKGKERSEETKLKISQTLRKNPIVLQHCLNCEKETTKRFCSKDCQKNYVCKCPHCEVSGNGFSLGAMKLFHFDNCKMIT